VDAAARNSCSCYLRNQTWSVNLVSRSGRFSVFGNGSRSTIATGTDSSALVGFRAQAPALDKVKSSHGASRLLFPWVAFTT
jgi:hypothetical protein